MERYCACKSALFRFCVLAARFVLLLRCVAKCTFALGRLHAHVQYCRSLPVISTLRLPELQFDGVHRGRLILGFLRYFKLCEESDTAWRYKGRHLMASGLRQVRASPERSENTVPQQQPTTETSKSWLRNQRGHLRKEG